MRQITPKTKVFYRPVEAAIRWAGLLRHEASILNCALSPRELPEVLGCPRQDELRLCLARINDGILNGELSYGKSGITSNEPALLDSPDLTVRHVDLKSWMRRYYPECRPAFLFARSERLAHPAITLQTGQALLVERQAMKVELKQCRRQLRNAHARNKALCIQYPVDQSPISDRAETTYLNIIGAMLDLILGKSPSGVRHSLFDTQEAVVSALVAHFGGRMGISERTLNGKFSRARKALSSTAA